MYNRHGHRSPAHQQWCALLSLSGECVVFVAACKIASQLVTINQSARQIWSNGQRLLCHNHGQLRTCMWAPDAIVHFWPKLLCMLTWMRLARRQGKISMLHCAGALVRSVDRDDRLDKGIVTLLVVAQERMLAVLTLQDSAAQQPLTLALLQVSSLLHSFQIIYGNRHSATDCCSHMP